MDMSGNGGSDRVLFVGLGVMGAPMAKQLADAGHDLVVFDVDRDRRAEVAAETGAEQTVDLPAAAAEADVVLLMLPNSDIVERVLVTDGVLAVLRPGSTVLDMSSSRPASTVELARRAATGGVAFVDAPVSGGRPRAETGELAIMAGGEAADVDRVRPLLSRMGSSLVHTGPAGSGHAMKALNNLLSAIGLLGAAEVITTGARFGLDPQVMLDVLNTSTGRNHATEVKFARYVLSGAFDAGFALRLMVKDVRTALELAEQTGTPVPLATEAVRTAAAAMAELDDPAADHTELAKWVAGNAGIDLTAGPKGS
jgi:3-hydroxyisobutyrate dehydrogenase